MSPHGSSASHFLDSNVVPMRLLHKDEPVDTILLLENGVEYGVMMMMMMIGEIEYDLNF